MEVEIIVTIIHQPHLVVVEEVRVLVEIGILLFRTGNIIFRNNNFNVFTTYGCFTMFCFIVFIFSVMLHHIRAVMVPFLQIRSCDI